MRCLGLGSSVTQLQLLWCVAFIRLLPPVSSVSVSIGNVLVAVIWNTSMSQKFSACVRVQRPRETENSIKLERRVKNEKISTVIETPPPHLPPSLVSHKLQIGGTLS